MTKKLTDKQIVGEAMYSARHSLTANVPLPPTNPDGSFKSVDQMVSESRYKNWQQQKMRESEYNAAVAAHEAEISNNPEQIAWERGQRQVRPVEYEWVIPDGVKLVFYTLLFIACVVALIYTGG